MVGAPGGSIRSATSPRKIFSLRAVDHVAVAGHQRRLDAALVVGLLHDLAVVPFTAALRLYAMLPEGKRAKILAEAKEAATDG